MLAYGMDVWYGPGLSQVMVRGSYDGDDWYLAIGFSAAMIGTCTVIDARFDLLLWATMNCFKNNIFTCEKLRTAMTSMERAENRG